MRLYCPSCNKIHEFTNGEVERIVYAAQGMFSDAAGAFSVGDDLSLNEVLPKRENWFPCLVQVLSAANDIEGYAEFVGQNVETRKHRRLDRASNRNAP